MQRFAHQTFLSACVHAQADAPKGRRNVATGGASPAAKRAERNPWTLSHLNNPAPEGRRELHGANKMPRSIFKRAPRIAHLSTQRASPSPLRGEKGMMNRFSTGSVRRRRTPPVAIARRPVGARASSGQGNSLTCPTWLPASGTPADTVTDPGGFCLLPFAFVAIGGKAVER